MSVPTSSSVHSLTSTQIQNDFPSVSEWTLASSSVLRVREASLVLNNTAVSLLSRRRYREALDTFKDSVDVIRSSIRRRRCTNHINDSKKISFSASLSSNACNTCSSSGASIPLQMSHSTDHETINKPLHKASRVLARVSSEKHLDEMKDYMCNGNLKEISDDASYDMILSLFSCQESFNEASSHRESCFAVRIQNTSGESVLDTNVDLDSALILYNYAVASRLIASDVKISHGVSTRHEQNALKLFQFSYEILSQLSMEDLDQTEISKFFLVSTLVLLNLCELSIDCQLEEQYHEYRSQLTYLHHSLQEQIDFRQSPESHDMLYCSDRLAAPAA